MNVFVPESDRLPDYSRTVRYEVGVFVDVKRGHRGWSKAYTGFADVCQGCLKDPKMPTQRHKGSDKDAVLQRPLVSIRWLNVCRDCSFVSYGTLARDVCVSSRGVALSGMRIIAAT